MSLPELEVLLPDSLDVIAVEVQQHHLKALRCARGALVLAAKCGRLLIEAKSRIKHGEWLPWLEQNFPGSKQTANNYMRVAGNWVFVQGAASNDQSSGHLSIYGALKAIAANDRAKAKEPLKAIAANDRAKAKEPEKAAVITPRVKLPIAKRAEQIRGLSEIGKNEHQIAKDIGVAPAYVRKLAREFSIQLPSNGLSQGSRPLDSIRVIREAVSGIEGVAMALRVVDLDFSLVSIADAKEWLSSFRDSLRGLKRLEKKLKEVIREEED